MKKPWDKGWIPPPKPIRKWEGPATPDGWTRVDREDCVEFTRDSTFWSYDRIIGRPGKKWRLYIDWQDCTFMADTSPDFTSSSLEALLVWYAVEKVSTPEPSPKDRHIAKMAALAANYGAGTARILSATAAFEMETRPLCKP